MGVGILLAFLLQWHFRRFGSTLSNRHEFANVFPFILLTTLLIITVVKSSLALSLGLVGALSIVRFRTPIKEPEELAYLFIAIAIGLGLGANQTVPTILASAIILTCIAGMKALKKTHQPRNLYLSIDLSNPTPESSPRLDLLNQVVSDYSVNSDLRRFDMRNGSIETNYFIEIQDPAQLTQLADELKQRFPNAGITFIDQNRLPTV